MQAAAGEVEKNFPAGIDHLINNAGILSDHVTHLNMCAHLTSISNVRRDVLCKAEDGRSAGQEVSCHVHRDVVPLLVLQADLTVLSLQ